jgi:RNA polymerase-binding protein DksA
MTDKNVCPTIVSTPAAHPAIADKVRTTPTDLRALHLLDCVAIMAYSASPFDRGGSCRKWWLATGIFRREGEMSPVAKALAKKSPSKKHPAIKAAKRPAAKPAAKLSQKNQKHDKKQDKQVKAGSESKPLLAKFARRPKPRADEIDPRPSPVSPVPTDGKPRRNQAGLTPKELEHYRDLLLAKRRELVGDMSSMEREALRTGGGSNLSNLPIHMADMGTDNYEQEFTLGLMEKDRDLLREINQALAKIQDGTYGICEGTGKPIGKPRLEAQPWARYSIEHARQMERGVMIR